MPTLSQLSKRGRKKKIKKIKATALRRIFNAKERRYKNIQAPQKRGVVTLVKTMTPKKPNSALKKSSKSKAFQQNRSYSLYSRSWTFII